MEVKCDSTLLPASCVAFAHSAFAFHLHNVPFPVTGNAHLLHHDCSNQTLHEHHILVSVFCQDEWRITECNLFLFIFNRFLLVSKEHPDRPDTVLLQLFIVIQIQMYFTCVYVIPLTSCWPHYSTYRLKIYFFKH